MEWDTFACRQRHCGTHWLVEPVDMMKELWHISPGQGEPAFLVAANEPICPNCGGNLQATLELAGLKQPTEARYL